MTLDVVWYRPQFIKKQKWTIRTSGDNLASLFNEPEYTYLWCELEVNGRALRKSSHQGETETRNRGQNSTLLHLGLAWSNFFVGRRRGHRVGCWRWDHNCWLLSFLGKGRTSFYFGGSPPCSPCPCSSVKYIRDATKELSISNIL